MKIGLIGAQGVGKTTLSKTLLRHYGNAHVVRETVRECPYPVDTEADFKTEWWVLSHSILAEQEAREAKHDLIITDRCLLDIAVYTKLIHNGNPNRMSRVQKKLIEQSISRWFEDDPYDLIVFLKVDPSVWQSRDLDDGFRNLDLGWYNALTTEFEAALTDFDVASKTSLHHLYNNSSFDSLHSQVVTLVDNVASEKGYPLKRHMVATL